MLLKEHPSHKMYYRAARPGDVEVTKANYMQLANLGWQTKVDIYEGIKNCFIKKGETE
jgi:hypothetical protein